MPLVHLFFPAPHSRARYSILFQGELQILIHRYPMGRNSESSWRVHLDVVAGSVRFFAALRVTTDTFPFASGIPLFSEWQPWIVKGENVWSKRNKYLPKRLIVILSAAKNLAKNKRPLFLLPAKREVQHDIGYPPIYGRDILLYSKANYKSWFIVILWVAIPSAV